MIARGASRGDADEIAVIYNEGIEDRIATFETEPRSADQILSWINSTHPVVVVVDESETVIAFAHCEPYRPRDCYQGIAEFSVYVARSSRRKGAGRMAMEALIEAAKQLGYWKLVSRIFPENTASLKLMNALGFREVGLYKSHGKLDGVWRDVVIVEFLIAQNLK